VLSLLSPSSQKTSVYKVSLLQSKWYISSHHRVRVITTVLVTCHILSVSVTLMYPSRFIFFFYIDDDPQDSCCFRNVHVTFDESLPTPTLSSTKEIYSNSSTGQSLHKVCGTLFSLWSDPIQDLILYLPTQPSVHEEFRSPTIIDELSIYLPNSVGPVSLVLDLLVVHDRFESNSDPTLNGHLHYPNDIDKSINETVTDKIRKYSADYNYNPPVGVAFMPIIASTSGRLHSEFVRLLFLQTHMETDPFLLLQEVRLRILPVDSSTSSVWCSPLILKQKSEVLPTFV
jgi:hypothetical protein